MGLELGCLSEGGGVSPKPLHFPARMDSRSLEYSISRVHSYPGSAPVCPSPTLAQSTVDQGGQWHLDCMASLYAFHLMGKERKCIVWLAKVGNKGSHYHWGSVPFPGGGAMSSGPPENLNDFQRGRRSTCVHVSTCM